MLWINLLQIIENKIVEIKEMNNNKYLINIIIIVTFISINYYYKYYY